MSNGNVPDVTTKSIMASDATLRDLFAGQALMGMCANSDISRGASVAKLTPEDVRISFAKSAYKVADAMIAEREKK